MDSGSGTSSVHEHTGNVGGSRAGDRVINNTGVGLSSGFLEGKDTDEGIRDACSSFLHKKKSLGMLSVCTTTGNEEYDSQAGGVKKSTLARSWADWKMGTQCLKMNTREGVLLRHGRDIHPTWVSVDNMTATLRV